MTRAIQAYENLFVYDTGPRGSELPNRNPFTDSLHYEELESPKEMLINGNWTAMA